MTMLHPARPPPPRPARPPRAPAPRPRPGPAVPGTACRRRRYRRRGGGSCPYAGRAAHVTAAPEYQATTAQVCGLYPFVAGSGTPAVGTPVGRHQLWGEVVCLDPLAWLRAGPGHQPRRVHPRPARHRQEHAGQTADHRRGRDRHPGHHPRRHQARLHDADRAPRRPGDPDRPGPGPDQPAGCRAAGRRAAPDDRPGRAGAALGSPLPAAVAADGPVHPGPRVPHHQRRGGHPRPRHRPARRTAARPAASPPSPTCWPSSRKPPTPCGPRPAPTPRPRSGTAPPTWSSPWTCWPPAAWPGCSTGRPPGRSTWTRPRSAWTSPGSARPATSC